MCIAIERVDTSRGMMRLSKSISSSSIHSACSGPSISFAIMTISSLCLLAAKRICRIGRVGGSLVCLWIVTCCLCSTLDAKYSSHTLQMRSSNTHCTEGQWKSYGSCLNDLVDLGSNSVQLILRAANNEGNFFLSRLPERSGDLRPSAVCSSGNGGGKKRRGTTLK